jgi:hypothetical protein
MLIWEEHISKELYEKSKKKLWEVQYGSARKYTTPFISTQVYFLRNVELLFKEVHAVNM